MKSVLIAALLVQLPGPSASQDTVEAIRREARRAEAEFERLARRMAPVRFSSRSGSDCDEIVGRFCLTYDDNGDVPEPPEEPDRVRLARRLAIEALRRAFSFQPGEFSTSGPLIRYLVEDDRAAEAVSAARTFAALTTDSIWAPLLLGFALHAAADDTAAERLFTEALRRMPSEERDRIRTVEWLLSPRDHGHYRRSSSDARDAMRDAIWSFADPLYLTAGNEALNQHIARHVWSRMLERAPVVGGALRWGRDLEELTVRYGIPTARSRTPGSPAREGSLVEHYDPDQLAFFPEDFLTRGPPPTPPPGDRWALENPRNRSGFAPVTVRKLRQLTHQLTRIPRGDRVLVRVDAELALDSAARGAERLRVGLWLRELNGAPVDSVVGVATVHADTARFRLETEAPAGTYLYSAEAFDAESRFAGRARFAVDIEAATTTLRVSDPLLAFPFGPGALPRSRSDAALRPRTNLVLQRGDTLGFFAEAHGLGTDAAGEAHYRVRLTLRPADRGSLPARIVSWLGDRLGLSSGDPPPRLSWTTRARASGPVAIAVDIPLPTDLEGLHLVVLEVTDLATGEAARSERLFRVGA